MQSRTWLPLQPAPDLGDLRPGSLICWPVNCRQVTPKRAVARFINDVCKAAAAEHKHRIKESAPNIRKLALLTSPECKEWSARNIVNRKRQCPQGVYAGRAATIKDIVFARQCHRQLRVKLDEHSSLSVHEQPLLARLPRRFANVMSYKDTQWPWTVVHENGLPGVNYPYAARVNGCAVGMVHMDKPVCKLWKVEVHHGTILKAVLASFHCPGNHEHAQIEDGQLARQSALYPLKLASVSADVVCA